MELQDPFCDSVNSSKNEGGRIRLCQNSVVFTLPTTVASVERTLVTTAALGSFSAALILLSPSTIIFSSDFAVSIADRNVARQAELCVPNLADLVSSMH